MQQPISILNKTDRLVYKTILKKKLCRSEIVEQTGIPRSTVYDSLNRSILMGLVIKTREKRLIPGRPKEFYEGVYNNGI